MISRALPATLVACAIACAAPALADHVFEPVPAPPDTLQPATAWCACVDGTVSDPWCAACVYSYASFCKINGEDALNEHGAKIVCETDSCQPIDLPNYPPVKDCDDPAAVCHGSFCSTSNSVSAGSCPQGAPGDTVTCEYTPTAGAYTTQTCEDFCGQHGGLQYHYCSQPNLYTRRNGWPEQECGTLPLYPDDEGRAELLSLPRDAEADCDCAGYHADPTSYICRLSDNTCWTVANGDFVPGFCETDEDCWDIAPVDRFIVGPVCVSGASLEGVTIPGNETICTPPLGCSYQIADLSKDVVCQEACADAGATHRSKKGHVEPGHPDHTGACPSASTTTLPPGTTTTTLGGPTTTTTLGEPGGSTEVWIHHEIAECNTPVRLDTKIGTIVEVPGCTVRWHVTDGP